MVVAGIVLFLLYRFMIQQLGVESLGAWSLVVALATLAKVGELGLPGSVVKFVARALAQGSPAEASRVVAISALATAGGLGVAAVVAYPLIAAALAQLLPGPQLAEAIAILPASLLAVWINGVAGVFLSALDGHQRSYQRSITIMLGAVALLGAALYLVPKMGLMGIVLAQSAQALVVTLLPAWLLRRELVSERTKAPSDWKALLKELLGYGSAFQLIALVGLLLDPMTKAILTLAGSTGTVAYFEMASKLVAQFRALIVAANQVVVPYIASLHATRPSRIIDVYNASWQMLFYITIPILAAVGAATPLVSEIWLGRYQQEFVTMALILIAANLINVLSGPAYFSNLGEGELRWNVIAHVLMAVLNGILGVALGLAFGIYGAVVGNAAAVALASVVIIFKFQAKRSIRLADLIHGEDIHLLVAGVSVVFLGLALHSWGQVDESLATKAIMSLTMVSVLLVLPMWRHPFRHRLGTLIADVMHRP